MSFRRLALLALVALLAAPSAFAQDDDFLVPLTDSKPAPSKKGKKRTPSTKSAQPKKTPKKGTAKKGTPARPDMTAQTPEPEDDALGLVPLVEGKTELLVKLSGTLKGARLLVDNKDVGTLPAPAQELSPGEHTVVVRRPGYTEFSQRVTVEAGQLTEVVVTLEPSAGVVAVNVDVPGAAIVIDGEPQGRAPLTGLLLKPGSHAIEARRDGFEPELKTITVRAGKEYTVDFTLRPAVGATRPPVEVARPTPPPPVELTPKPKPQPQPDEAAVALAPDVETRDAVESGGTPLLKRWYFWAGVGAVVAAGAAAGVVMTQGSPATPLTLRDVCGDSPCDGQINGPAGAGLVRF